MVVERTTALEHLYSRRQAATLAEAEGAAAATLRASCATNNLAEILVLVASRRSSRTLHAL